jgi:hypothetical protein
MSTLEVECARCDRRFRVRAEFAGKTSRCPGCSAPLVIGGSKPAPAPRPEPEDRPRPRPRPRDGEDDRPRGPTGDWKPVATALGREQVAVAFVLMTILCSYLVFCLGNATRGVGPPEAIVITLMLLLLVGPSLVAGVFGLAARVAAVSAPAQAHARGSAVASLLCGLGGLASLVMIGISILASIEQQQHQSDLPMIVATGGVILSTLAALGTFMGFVAQVGIARRSAAVSRAVGRTAVAGGVCVLVLLGIGMLYTLAAEATGPSYTPYGGYYRDDSPFFQVMTGVLFPLAFAVVLVTYHRLLAATRAAVLGEAGGRDEG